MTFNLGLNNTASLRTANVTVTSGALTARYTLNQQSTSTSLAASYSFPTDVPVTANGYTATGSTVNFSLNFIPSTGTQLMVVNNTGLGFINGTFSNLAQGQMVPLTYGGLTYNFVANYYGGSGNDLVLQWANTRVLGWGINAQGQLGNNGTASSLVPVAVNATGALSGKTVLGISESPYHSLALRSDGTVVAWGYGGQGQLGNGGTAQSNVPVTVNTTAGVSALAGKTVIAVSAGSYHSLALCSDGTVAAWGYNASGRLGNNSTTASNVPVAVNTTAGVSALAGKTVVAISAGGDFSLALCSDGSVVAWGYNGQGALGNNTITDSPVPVAVETSGALSGKTLSAIATGGSHNLALCSDGTMVAWGYNGDGELGNNTTTQSNVPVPVVTSGVLFGKTVVSIAAGGNQNLALCSEGTLVSWGSNSQGLLGNNSSLNSSVPVLVNMATALSGKTVVAISGGLDIPLSRSFTGTVRINAGFPSDRNADMGILIGAGYNIGN